MKINKSIKLKVNNILYDLCKQYYKLIPLNTITNYLKQNNLIILQEDGSEFEGFLCGCEGRTSFLMRDIEQNKNIKDSILWLSWYKMTSGNYEVVCYLS